VIELDCEQINQMLSAYRDGELKKRDMRRVTSHLSVCMRCNEDFTEIVRVREVIRSIPDPLPTSTFWPNMFLQIREGSPSPKIRSFYRAYQHTAWGLSIVLLVFWTLMLAPRKVDDARQQLPVMHPYALISLYASMRNDQPLADSGSLRYAIADRGRSDWDNDDAGRAD